MNSSTLDNLSCGYCRAPLVDHDLMALKICNHRLTEWLDDAHIRNAKDQDEHSEQRAALAKEVERLTADKEALLMSEKGNREECQHWAWRFATARADAIREAIKIIDAAGEEWGDLARNRKSKTYSAYAIAALDLRGRLEQLQGEGKARL